MLDRLGIRTSKTMNTNATQLGKTLQNARVLLQQNRLEEAHQHFMAVLASIPNQADAIFGIATIQHKTGNVSGAIDTLKKLAQIAPNFAHGRATLANLLLQTNQHQQSIEQYEWLLKNKGAHQSVLYYLAVNYSKLKQHETAISLLEKAIALAPDEALLHEWHAQELYATRDFARAAQSYQKAFELGARSVALFTRLGKALETIGRTSEAKKILQTAIQTYPQDMLLRYQCLRIDNSGISEDDRALIQSCIAEADSEEQQAYGHFLLAGLEHGQSHYEQALEHLLDGHALYRQQECFSHSTEFFLEELPALAKERSADSLSTTAHCEFREQVNPVFIIGAPRTGSTLIESMLKTGAPQLTDTEESGVMLHASDLRQQTNSDEWLSAYTNTIIQTYRHFGINETTEAFTDKSLDNFYVVDLILKLFPNAKIVWMKRHPYATAMSILQNNMVYLPWAHDLKDIFKYFEALDALMQHWQQKYPNRVYEIQYEDLVSEPEKFSKKLFDYCDLEWSEQCLQFYKNKNKASKTASNSQIRQKLYTKAINAFAPYEPYLDQKLGAHN